MYTKKGQVSFEYLLIVGFAILSIVSIGIFATFTFQNFSDQVSVKQAQRSSELLVNAAELVYAYGEPTFITQSIYVPLNAKEIIVQANEVTLRIETSRGITDVTSFASVNMSGTISSNAGKKDIIVTAGTSSVTFS